MHFQITEIIAHMLFYTHTCQCSFLHLTSTLFTSKRSIAQDKKEIRCLTFLVLWTSFPISGFYLPVLMRHWLLVFLWIWNTWAATSLLLCQDFLLFNSLIKIYCLCVFKISWHVNLFNLAMLNFISYILNCSRELYAVKVYNVFFLVLLRQGLGWPKTW